MLSFLMLILAGLAVVAGYAIITAVGFGSILAIIISWNRNGSVLWAVLHGWLGWFYVIYHCLQRKSATH